MQPWPVLLEAAKREAALGASLEQVGGVAAGRELHPPRGPTLSGIADEAGVKLTTFEVVAAFIWRAR